MHGATIQVQGMRWSIRQRPDVLNLAAAGAGPQSRIAAIHRATEAYRILLRKRLYMHVIYHYYYSF